MKLNVNERLTLVRAVPEKGNFVTMSTVENLKAILHLSEDEVKEFELKEAGGMLTWNKGGSEPKELELSELGLELLQKQFEEMDKKEELTLPDFHLFKRLKEETEPKEVEPETKQ